MAHAQKYKFTVCYGADDCYEYEKTESELTKEDKDMLLGQLIHHFNKSPSEVRKKFWEQVMNQIADQLDEENESAIIKLIKKNED